VIQRAVIHVQSSGREEVTGANVLVAIFAERESHAAYFLQEQDMTRYDAVNYISHGIAKRPGRCPSRAPVRGVEEEEASARARARKEKKKGDALEAYCVNLNKKAREGKIDPLIGRDPSSSAHDPGAVPAPEEQSALRRRSRRRQDGDRRGAGAPIVEGEVPDVLPKRRSSRSTWARCSPAPAIAAISRSGSSR
jgi:ATP-dependent Clp protease ATP-binding subunit ClpA